MIWLGLSSWQEQQLQTIRRMVEGRDRHNRHYIADDGQVPPEQHSLAIYSIVDDDYWKRVWILQEVARAKSVVVEMQEIPPFSLDELFETVSGYGCWTRGIRGPSGRYGCPYMRLVAGTRRRPGIAHDMPMRPIPSWQLFADHFQRRCSRPHDRVYGLLGLLEEGDPMRCIEINYDKPASDVFFDALLMLPVYHDTRAIELLTLEGFMEDPNSLEEYCDRAQTMRILKRFASVVLEVYDALNLIMAENGFYRISGRFYGLGITAVPDLIRNSQVDNRIPDELQGKAILGIILAIGTSNAEQRHAKWRELRWSKLKAQFRSSWLCARHARPVPARWSERPKYSAALRKVQFPRRTWSTNRTCARHHQFGRACEGPKMILDISHIGFRLELDFAVPGLSSVYLDPEKMLENRAEEPRWRKLLFLQG